MVYISEDGEVICDYLQPKKLLDTMRFVCKGKDKPIEVLYHRFNEETNDGRSMEDIFGTAVRGHQFHHRCEGRKRYRQLVFSRWYICTDRPAVSGLEDFELICFLVLKDE